MEDCKHWYPTHGDHDVTPDDFDSQEEWWFYLWCVEAMDAGIIEECMYHTESFELTPSYRLPMANNTKFTLRPHKYTPDFFIWFNGSMDAHYKEMIGHLYTYSWMGSWVDIKGKFQRHGGDRVFAMNQKMMMKEHNVAVHKIVPEIFFKKTWVPVGALSGKRKTRLKRWDGCKTLQEVIDGIDA